MSEQPKILIVDDNPNNRLTMRTVLKGVDAELHEADNGFDALTMALAERYAMILLDVQMPEIDGFEVCEQLRADPRTADTPVIFLSAAYKGVKDKIRGYVAGATDYLSKPIEDHILKAKVQVFLKLYNQQCLLQENNAFLRVAATVFESQQAIIVSDAQVNVMQVNQAFVQVTGYLPEEVIGKVPEMLRSKRHSNEFYTDIKNALTRNNYWQGEIHTNRKNGEDFPCWLTVSAVLDSVGKLTNYVSTFSDMTRYKQAEEKIHNLAFYDPLTGLPNRRLLIDRISLVNASSARSNNHGALMFLDLDNFKVLNDTQGHYIGDHLLMEVGLRLQACVREKDTVARLGGDEFVVMLDDLDADNDQAVIQAQAVAEKLLNSLAEPYRLVTTTAVGQSALEHRCTTSIGITLFRFHQDSVEEMLKRADAAMYQAKGAGRNTIRFFDPAIQKVLLARSEMAGQLHQSLDKHELLLHYQMQVNADGSPIGVELLLRWNHPERGMIPPLDFIPLAEDNGYIVPIGLWILNTACHQLKRWQCMVQLEKLELAVNVSARQFKQSDFVSRVRESLNQTGINPALLKIELTESVILDNVKEAIAKMRELKDLGVSLSMDDFGTGYSSLSYLQRMPLDELKIDQSFVRDMLASNNSENIVKTIIMLANGMNMSMIAEGVETQEQFEFLKSKGCSGFQGYLFSKPLPLQVFEKRILERG